MAVMVLVLGFPEDHQVVLVGSRGVDLQDAAVVVRNLCEEGRAHVDDSYVLHASGKEMSVRPFFWI